MRTSVAMRIMCIAVVAMLLAPASALCGYRKIDQPPDVDKDFENNTCWLATAANMLAGAGYGHSCGNDSVQVRARYIYDQLVAHFGYEQ